MANRNYNRSENEKGKTKFWKTLWVIALSVFLAVLTVILINI